MTDVFGNYVIQKYFEFGSQEQKAQLVGKVTGIDICIGSYIDSQ